MVPIPYPITANLSDSMTTSTNVKFGGDLAYIHDKSKVSKVTGDEAGTSGGVQSGTNRSIVETIQGSGTVNVNKKPIVRHGEPAKMNNGNTMGKVIYQGTSTGSSSGSNANPPVEPETPKENDLWSQTSDGVHTTDDVPGLGA